jgi:hypothetical protein
VPEPEQHVFEKPTVGILMDLGKLHTEVERRSLSNGLPYYGADYHDTQAINPDEIRDVAQQVYERDPQCWENIARAQLLNVQASQNDADRVVALQNLGVVVLGWLDDIGRAPRPVLAGA